MFYCCNLSGRLVRWKLLLMSLSMRFKTFRDWFPRCLMSLPSCYTNRILTSVSQVMVNPHIWVQSVVLEQRLKKKKIFSISFSDIYFIPLTCLRGLTLPPIPMLMTTWMTVLKQIIGWSKPTIPGARWYGYSNIDTENVGEAEIWSILSPRPGHWSHSS